MPGRISSAMVILALLSALAVGCKSGGPRSGMGGPTNAPAAGTPGSGAQTPGATATPSQRAAVLGRLQPGMIVRVNDIPRAKVLSASATEYEFDIFDETAGDFVGNILAMTAPEITDIAILEGDTLAAAPETPPASPTEEAPPATPGTAETPPTGETPPPQTGEPPVGTTPEGPPTPPPAETPVAPPPGPSEPAANPPPTQEPVAPPNPPPATTGTPGTPPPTTVSAADDQDLHDGHVILDVEQAFDLARFERAATGGTGRYRRTVSGLVEDSRGETFERYVSRGTVALHEGDRVAISSVLYRPPEAADPGILFEEGEGTQAMRWSPEEPPAYQLWIRRPDGRTEVVTTADALQRGRLNDDDVVRFLDHEPIVVEMFAAPAAHPDRWESTGAAVFELSLWSRLARDLRQAAEETSSVRARLAWYAQPSERRPPFEEIVIGPDGRTERIQLDAAAFAERYGTPDANREAWNRAVAGARRLLADAGLDPGDRRAIVRVRGFDVGRSLALDPSDPIDIDFSDPPPAM